MNKVFTSNPEKNMGFFRSILLQEKKKKKKVRFSKVILTQVRGGSRGLRGE